MKTITSTQELNSLIITTISVKALHLTEDDE